jgi:NifB/MoaA-like Fe-S oxidoreductase
VTPQFCRKVIAEIGPRQEEFRRRLKTNFAFLGDEIYLRAGCAIPSRSHYGDYPQIEDGIGMVRSFENEFAALLRRLQRESKTHERRCGTILTGTLFAPVLTRWIEKLNRQAGAQFHVLPVANKYFGGDVSVAGLVTGGDVLNARTEIEGDFVIIPRTMLKSDDAIMLDGVTLAELKQELALPVHAFDLKEFSQFVSAN